jgi:hypothetical protein
MTSVWKKVRMWKSILVAFITNKSHTYIKLMTKENVLGTAGTLLK